MLLRSLILRVTGRDWVERFVRNSPITRKVVKRFIAGDTLEEAISVAEDLRADGFRVTLDFLGEHTTNEQEAESAAQEYEQMLHRIADSPYSGGYIPENINISIKLTQIGLLIDEAECTRRLEKLTATAAGYRNFVRIDMEDSGCTERTLAAAVSVFRKSNNVGLVLQSMLFRTERDIDEMIRLGMRVRLVKGAYLEPKVVAYQDKRDVDRAFSACGKRLVIGGLFPAFGTHDARLIDEIIEFAEANGVGKGRFEFQFLYGIRRGLQAELKKRGFIVRVYVPYGNSWYPYFTRRLAERPANLLFFLRSLISR